MENKIDCSDQTNIVKLDNLESHTKKIKKTIEGISKEFIRVGFLLWEVREYKLFESKGYKDVVEYAKEELGFKRSSTFNFISIAENFSQKKDGKPTQFIDLSYKKYGYTKLTQILSLDEEERKLISDNMSVREIKKVKKQLKESKKNNPIEKNSPTDWTENLKGQLKIESDKVVEVEYEEVKENDSNVIDHYANYEKCRKEIYSKYQDCIDQSRENNDYDEIMILQEKAKVFIEALNILDKYYA